MRAIPAGGPPGITNAPALQFLEVCGGYGRQLILQQLSLSLGKGDILVLIGPNGSGKSTLLKTASGLLRPSAGSIHLAGAEITRWGVHERVRGGLSYLMQGGPVFPSLTVRENLEMGSMIPSHGRTAAHLEDVLETLPGLKPNLNRRAGLLSGGQRQALALGMVLAHTPQVLLLDEPTAGLSPDRAAEFMHTILDLNQTRGISVLLVEQRVREALRVARSAAVLVSGAVAAVTESPIEWLEEGALDRYFFGQ